MKDKMILVFYVDIRDIENQGDMQEYLNTLKNTVSNQVEGDGEDTMIFFVPIKGESKVECVNPVLVTEKEAIDKFNSAMESLQKLNFKLETKLVNKK